MKTKLNKVLNLVCVCTLLASCGNIGGSKKLTDYGSLTEEDDDTPVNVIEQSMPTIMVLPSDNLLKNSNALQVIETNGTCTYQRDYSKFLVENTSNRQTISIIQNEFVNLGFPLTDLEQLLKQLSTKTALDLADGVEQDAKTLLLQTARPDIIIEIDYDFKLNSMDPNFSKNLSYTLAFFDAYTSKAISSTSVANVSGKDFQTTLESSIHKSMKKISREITNYFSDIVVHGREITVRFTIEKGANINLSSECITGDTYADWIMDYMDLHAKKGTYKLQTNTDKELYFTSVRIPTVQKDGTQFSAYKWARICMHNLKTECGVKCVNKVQGLGDVHIMIKGL